MIPLKSAFGCFVLCLAASGQVLSQTEKAIQPVSQSIRLISTTKTSTFEKELNDAAKEGYRLTRLGKGVYSGGLKAIVFRALETAGNSAQSRYEYKVLATFKLATMRIELEKAAADGYEFRGITTENNELPFSSKETVAVLERPVGQTTRRFEYRLVTAGKTLDELDALSADGFAPVEMFVTDKSSIENTFSFSLSTLRLNFIFSREANKSDTKASAGNYRVIWKADPVKMETEMNQLAKEGFQLDLVSIYPIVLMSRSKQPQPQKYEYRVLTDSRKNPLLKQIADAGSHGYQFRGISFRGAFYGGAPYQQEGMVSVMEREISISTASSQSSQIDYKLLIGSRENIVMKELDEALTSGYSFGDILKLNAPMVVLSRKIQ